MFTKTRGKVSIIKSKIKQIGNNEEVLDTIIVSIATLVGSVFSYLLQFVLGRKLSVEDYGTFNTLLSLTTIVGVLSGVLGTALIKVSAEMYAKDKDNGKLEYFLYKTLAFSFLALIISFFLGVLFSNFVSIYLNINDSVLIMLLGLFVGLSFLLIVPQAFLQGVQKFRRYSIFHVVNMVLRLVIPIVFVYAGFSIRGVWVGLSVSYVFSFLLGMLLLKVKVKNVEKKDISSYLEKLKSLSVSIILVNFALMFLNNIDVIMVKKYFSPTEAGYYSGTVTLGKILLFGAGAFTTVMFPRITALYVSGKEFIHKLKMIFFLLLGVLFVGVLCYRIFPEFLTRVFFGEAFMSSQEYLPLFSIFVSIYVLINFLVMFFLAIDKKAVGFLLLPGVVAQYILLNIFHDSLWDVIKINIGVSVFILVLLLVYGLFGKILNKMSSFEKSRKFK